LAGFPRPNIDPRIIQTTQDLPNEFFFNEDMNSGNHLGLGITSSLATVEVELTLLIVGWTQTTINGARRSSSATSYLGPEFISRTNLHIVVNARVTRLLKTGTTADGTPEILGVEFVNGGNTSTQ